ncbi:unnamed protein product [Thlaspi arvense]|uniref:Uncharacterized protein n=1 Tax=Thlaspi arvense TaxID=13288 RepID=A0AAU9SQ97_THLAR|nr:unnamed protein product [Thlaspi arvense]
MTSLAADESLQPSLATDESHTEIEILYCQRVHAFPSSSLVLGIEISHPSREKNSDSLEFSRHIRLYLFVDSEISGGLALAVISSSPPGETFCCLSCLPFVQDVKVNNLIEDIRENRLNTNAWNVIEASVSKKRHVPQQSSQIKNTTKIHFAEAATAEVSDECYVERNKTNVGQNSGNIRVTSETEKANIGIVKMVKALTEKVENMKTEMA